MNYIMKDGDITLAVKRRKNQKKKLEPLFFIYTVNLSFKANKEKKNRQRHPSSRWSRSCPCEAERFRERSAISSALHCKKR